MKNNLSALALSAVMIVAGATITSCKKSDSTTTTTSSTSQDTNTSSAKDYQDAENNSNDVDQMGSEGMDNGNINSNYKLAGGGLLSPLSGSVNVVANAAAKSVTLTFVNYVGLDGHLRTGSLTYDYSSSIIASASHYRDSGIVINVTSNNYFVDSNKVQISKTITNMGRNATTHNLTWHITSNIVITKANNGGTIQFSSDRYNALLNTTSITYNNLSVQASFSGYATAINWSEAIIGVTDGPSATSGTSADNVAFSAHISTMLVRNFGCSPASLPLLHPHFHPFVAGQIDFTPAGKTTRSINFGAGACDEIYTITIGSWSATITYVF